MRDWRARRRACRSSLSLAALLGVAIILAGPAWAQPAEADKAKQLEQTLTGGTQHLWAPKGTAAAGAGPCLDGESYRFALADHDVTIERCQAGKVAQTSKAKWAVEQRGPFLVRLKIREQEFEAQVTQVSDRPVLKLRQAQMSGNFVRPIEKELERID
ncbi:MAG: hypothetical protein HYR63_08865 [Proteobacteria bacterium]|nr:hypothetical protein [Pseudomonadota bacterium]MBI3499863.1 hypothetical protein [Pseudomonadota bacterium]